MTIAAQRSRARLRPGREIRFGLSALRARPIVALLLWSIPETLPTALSGLAISRAVDTGFLVGRPWVGVAWLAGLIAAALVGAIGARQVYRTLGSLVEPFRDTLVRRVVDGALHHGISGGRDDGAVARLTRQVEIVRDSYAGLLVVLRGFAVTVIGVTVGLLSVDPMIALLILPPFVLGFLLFLLTLGLAADRQDFAVRAEEWLAHSAGDVLSARRDIVACGGEESASGMVSKRITQQASAELALAKVAVLRALCLAVGGWLPLVVLLVASPWLASSGLAGPGVGSSTGAATGGLTAGTLMGGLTYVLFGLQPTLRTLIAALGDSGMRFVITLRRILDTSKPTDSQDYSRSPEDTASSGTKQAERTGLAFSERTEKEDDHRPYALKTKGLTFAYGQFSEPVVSGLSIQIPEGDHLAIVGPSGIGKSTLANLLSGLLEPTSGGVLVGDVAVGSLSPAKLAATRVLIPQEAYVFSAPLWDNLTYLRSDAPTAEVDRAAAQLGADRLIARLGGYDARVAPSDLSAGERQLLSLVRAYLSPAPVAILDEATCHLDPAAERTAEDAFADRPGTLIVIAHRISSALRAQRILMLDGSSALLGDHATILAESPLYKELLGHWEAQPTHLVAKS